MDIRTSKNHRILQVFISKNGVFEVYVNLKTKTYACTCPGYRARLWCKHCESVGTKFLQGGGAYGVPICAGAPPLNDDIMCDPVRFRDWVIHHAKVEVLNG